MKVKRNILLNPGPATTSDSVKRALVVPDICPREKEFCAIVSSVRSQLLQVVNAEADYDCVIFGGSGTASVEAVISSVVPAGKKVLVVSNGAYGTRMIQIAQRYGIGVMAYEIPYGDYPAAAAVEKLLQENEGELSHLAIVHHETTTGMLNPIEDFLRLARRFRLEIIVDAISSYAGIPMDLARTDYDYVISTANKNLQGMAGLSFVIAKKSLLQDLRRRPQRSFYLSLGDQYAFLDQHQQMQFTAPVQIIYALKQALTEYFAEGGQARWQRYVANWEALVAGLAGIGFKLLLPLSAQSKLLTAVSEPADSRYDFDHMHDHLYERGFTIYPGKGAKNSCFRVANIGDIGVADIEDFLQALREYVALRGIRNFS